EQKRLQDEAAAAEEKAKEKETEFDSFKTALKKHFPQKPTEPAENEAETELTEINEADEVKENEPFIEVIKKAISGLVVQDEAPEVKDKERIINALKKRFGQKNPLDEFTDAIAVLDNIIL
ncbi:MAG: hypothetical protein IIX98_03665, partial [Clostridia bacterium]|nr:hypothetical protein [Clostridia bacterium]